MIKGLFVTGTDTGVGKTVASAWLVHQLAADYWKPIQSGLDDGEGDTEVVARLALPMIGSFHPPAVTLHAPLSPHEAARLEGRSIDLASLSCPESSRCLVVEGAGGVLVPLNDTARMVDLMVRLALPVLLVARTTLGTINHTLLSLEALRQRGLTVSGVILNGPANPANRRAIAQFGAVDILAELPPLAAVTSETLRAIVPLAPFSSLLARCADSL